MMKSIFLRKLMCTPNYTFSSNIANQKVDNEFSKFLYKFKKITH